MACSIAEPEDEKENPKPPQSDSDSDSDTELPMMWVFKTFMTLMAYDNVRRYYRFKPFVIDC